MKKKGTDPQKTDELLQKLQASLLSKHRESHEAPDADDAAFQEKIADLLRGVTTDSATNSARASAPNKEKKRERTRRSAPDATASHKELPSAPRAEERRTKETTSEQGEETEPASGAIDQREKQEKHVPQALRFLTADPSDTPPMTEEVPNPSEREPVLQPTPSKREDIVPQQNKRNESARSVRAEPQTETEEKPVRVEKMPEVVKEREATANATLEGDEKPKQTEPKKVEQEDASAVVIRPPRARDVRPQEPIVIKVKPRSAEPTSVSKVDSGDRKQDAPISEKPIAIKPPKSGTTSAREENGAQKKAARQEGKSGKEPKRVQSGVSLPRSHRSDSAAHERAERTVGSTAAAKPLPPRKKKESVKPNSRGANSVNRTPVSPLPMDPSLSEALDDTVEAMPELISMDAPDPAEISAEKGSARTSFFSRRREKKNEMQDSGDALALIRKKTGMNEDDVAMIFELGYDNELGRAVGFDLLKKLRYEHKQKTREAEHRHFRTAFGYRGEDGADGAKQSALAAYVHDRNHLIRRVILTALCTLLLAVADIPSLFALGAYQSAYPWLFAAVSLGLLTASGALSYRQIDAGLRSWFRFTPTPYSAVAILAPISWIYGAVILLVSCVTQSPTALLPIGFGTSCALLLTALCDALRLGCEMRCYRLSTAEGDKTVLESTEPRKKKLRHGDRIVRIINDEIDQTLYRVRKSERVTGFFHRCNDFSSAAHPFSILLCVMLGTAVLCGVVGAVRSDSFAVGVSTFAYTLNFTVPTSSVLLYFYPLCRANKILSRDNAALIGESSVTEYSRSKTVIFNDRDLYAAQTCTQISVRDGEDFRSDMRLAGILFRKMGGTLETVGKSAPIDKGKDDLPVVFLRMTDNGAEALIDNRHHILAGNAAFLGKSGVRIPRESTDRAAKRAGNVSLMYVAIDGVLKLSYEIEYRASAAFEEMARILANSDTVAAIQTYDPNLNDAFLRSARGEGVADVRVIKPGRYEQDGVQQVVESGVLALGNTTDIAKPLVAAGRIVAVRRKGFRVLSAVSVCGAALGVAVGFFSTHLSLGAVVLLPTVYRALCDVVTLLAARADLSDDSED